MIPIAKPTLGEEEAEAARDAILSGWVTQGPRVLAFETAFAERTGSAHACAVSNCTTALHMALLAVGVKPGNVVVTVSHSFIATANAVRYCGAEPVFVDVEENGFNMSVAKLERLLYKDCAPMAGGLYYKPALFFEKGGGPFSEADVKRFSGSVEFGRVAAVLPVHQMGFPCRIGKIVALARHYGLPVVEDAACAIGSMVWDDRHRQWEPVGKPHGDAACFSFHPRKILTTGEGGMITTNRPDLDAQFRLLRQHGMSVPDTVRHGASRVIFESYVSMAYNYRMTDIQASIGIEQLKKLDDILEKRRKIAGRYAGHLAGMAGLAATVPDRGTLPNYQSFPVRLKPDFPMDLKAAMQFLLENGISTRRGIMNAHQETPYIAGGWMLPNSENSRDRVMLLPLFDGMADNDIKIVTDALRRLTDR